MVTVIQEQNPWASIAERGVDNAIKGTVQRSDEMALKKTLESLGEDSDPRDVLKAIMGTKTYNNESKQQALQNYLGVEKFGEVKRHAIKQEQIAQEKNELAKQKKLSEEQKEIQKQQLIADGMPDWEADVYLNSPDSVKNRIQQTHQDLKQRGIRTPIGQAQPQQLPQQNLQQVETPAAPPPEQGQVGPEIPSPQQIEESVDKEIPEKDEWPELKPPQGTTYSEKEKWRTANQKFNNDELKEVRKKLTGRKDSLIRYNRLGILNNSDKLPSGMGNVVINPSTGEPYAIASLAGVVNKETQDFVKTMNDFLAHAKDFFGARVTNFDIQAFKSRLPSLLNTPDGRRLIIEQMKLMEELQVVHDEELEKGLKYYGRNANYSDITKVVDDKVAVKQQEVLNKMDNLDKASDMMDVMQKSPKYKNTTLMQSPPSEKHPNGQWKAVPNDQVNAAKGKKWIKW